MLRCSFFADGVGLPLHAVEEALLFLVAGGLVQVSEQFWAAVAAGIALYSSAGVKVCLCRHRWEARVPPLAPSVNGERAWLAEGQKVCVFVWCPSWLCTTSFGLGVAGVSPHPPTRLEDIRPPLWGFTDI